MAIANSLLFIVDCEDEGVLILPIPNNGQVFETGKRRSNLLSALEGSACSSESITRAPNVRGQSPSPQQRGSQVYR